MNMTRLEHNEAARMKKKYKSIYNGLLREIAMAVRENVYAYVCT